MLTYLATVARGPAQRVEVLMSLISSLIDLNPNMSTHLKTSLWKKWVGGPEGRGGGGSGGGLSHGPAQT